MIEDQYFIVGEETKSGSTHYINLCARVKFNDPHPFNRIMERLEEINKKNNMDYIIKNITKLT